jgi:hypothetical protein
MATLIVILETEAVVTVERAQRRRTSPLTVTRIII